MKIIHHLVKPLLRINRYMLGCKLRALISFFRELTGINRYMLGCKCFIYFRRWVKIRELIDTCWDVNVAEYLSFNCCIPELIDSCWDVNEFSINNKVHKSTELIDTCWDVNYLINHEKTLCSTRINRYMLGCK